MKYFRPVDWDAFPKDDFKVQILADRSTGVEECVFGVVRCPVGKASPAGLHTHKVDQFYYVLQGTVGIQLGKDKHEAGPGSFIFIPAGLTHAAWNAGTEVGIHVEMLCPHPPEGEPRGFKAEEPNDAPKDVELIRKVDWDAFETSTSLSQNLGSHANGVHSLSFNVFKMPAGKGVSTPHMHGFAHIYYIIQGKLQISMGFDEYEIGAGTFGIIPQWLAHCNRNEGPETQINLNIRIPEATTPFMQGTSLTYNDPQGRDPVG